VIKSLQISLSLFCLLSQNGMAETGVKPVAMEPISMGSMLQLFASLIFVLLVFALVIFVMRRLSGINPAARGHMKIIDGLSLGTRDRIVLLQVGAEQILLGISPGQIRTLHVLTEPVDFAAEQTSIPFAQKLKNAMQSAQRGQKPVSDGSERVEP
jgi:flagellar protein FliO/FliZ